MFPERIETDRLVLKRHDRAVDALELYEYAGASDTISAETEYLTWDPHDTPGESAAILDDFETGWEDREDAVYALYPGEDEPGAGTFAGNAGLHVDWDRETATLGIWLRKPFWGRGYASERALAFADLAFDRLDLSLLAVEHLPENEKSARAIEKYMEQLGGRREGRFRNRLGLDTGPADVIRWSVDRTQWAGSDPATDVRFQETLEAAGDPR